MLYVDILFSIYIEEESYHFTSRYGTRHSAGILGGGLVAEGDRLKFI